MQWNANRNNSNGTQQVTNTNGWQQGKGMVSDSLNNGETQTNNFNILDQKRKQAKAYIANITSLEDAKVLLNKLCDAGGEWLLDKING